MVCISGTSKPVVRYRRGHLQQRSSRLSDHCGVFASRLWCSWTELVSTARRSRPLPYGEMVCISGTTKPVSRYRRGHFQQRSSRLSDHCGVLARRLWCSWTELVSTARLSRPVLYREMVCISGTTKPVDRYRRGHFQQRSSRLSVHCGVLARRLWCSWTELVSTARLSRPVLYMGR